MTINPQPTDQEFNKKEYPFFIDLDFGDLYCVRMHKTTDMLHGEPIYRIQGTQRNIQEMQIKLDVLFPRRAHK